MTRETPQTRIISLAWVSSETQSASRFSSYLGHKLKGRGVPGVPSGEREN